MKEDWETGDDLLIKTSKLITANKLKGKVPVSDDFIAFGTDWSMEYDIETILLKCGADKDNVKQWKKLNWF
ncbi:hypothetical protein [Parafilimonas terrae]|nr:hypothetical protein [Parafilimonas terrae]